MVQLKEFHLSVDHTNISMAVYVDIDANSSFTLSKVYFCKNKLPHITNNAVDNSDAYIDTYTVTYNSNTKIYSANLDISNITNIDFSTDFVLVTILYDIADANGSTISQLNTISWDTRYIFRQMMNCLSEIESEGKCRLPSNFLNSFLRYKAIYMAAITGHLSKALDLYNKYFNNQTTLVAHCNCNG